MQFAIDNHCNRVRIDEAVQEDKYYCPYCKGLLIQRRGKIRIPHFAHTKGSCTDSWKYEGMTEWHIGWQSQFPDDNREVFMEVEGEKHRADVFINGTVVEFQHSPIAIEEFKKRNRFYTSGGFKVIWLFDARDAYPSKLYKPDDETDRYEWKYAPKTLKDFDIHGDTQIYLHIIDKSNDGEGKIIRVCSGRLDYFKTYSTTEYTEKSFVDLIKTGNYRCNDNSLSLTHTLHAIKRDNGTYEYYGCPINDDGYAPKKSEEKRASCNQCSFCQSWSYDKVSCSWRYKEYINSISCILESGTDSSIHYFTYLDLDGKICEAEVSAPGSPGMTIIDLFRRYGATVMGVRSLKYGTKVKITKNPFEMYGKYGRVYGYLWDTRGKAYKNESREIYSPYREDWVMEWYH